jgi:ribosome-associated translation inhibitor RaiA
MHHADRRERLLVGGRRGRVELEIRISSIDSHGALQAYVRRRVGFALGRFSPSIRRVAVRVTEVSAVHGGVDTECRIAVRLFRMGRIALIERAADLHAAIDRGIERLQRTVARRMGCDRSV